MGTQKKPRRDNRPPNRQRPAPAAGDRQDAPPSTQTLASDSKKCPELRDLLGDYSEQTGSFFG